MKKLFAILVLCLLIASPSFAALTKSTEAHDEWAEIATNSLREGATEDISGCYASSLTIFCALSAETAHTGTQIFVQVSANTTDDEDWFNLVVFATTNGTANGQSLGGVEAAGSTVLEVVSTTGYEVAGVIPIFIEDDIVANSEVVWLVSHEATPSVTIQDATEQAHDASDSLWNIVDVYTISIPIEYCRVRILYDNTFDANGSPLYTYSRISKVTGL